MTMTRLLLGSLLAALLAAPAGAADAPAAGLPKDMPPFGPDKPLPVPEIAQKTLPNGLTVWVIARNGVPRVDYVLAVRGAGHAADDPALPGFASTLAALLTEGTEQRDSKAIAEAAQALGGSVGAGADDDALTVRANALPSKAADMLMLLAEVVRKPTFPAAEVELAKANALQALKASEAQPGYLAERALGPVLFGDHPYGRNDPTEASIAAITRDTLQAAHAQRLRPDQALLVVTGRIGADAAFALAERAFGDWRADGKAAGAILPARSESKPDFVHVPREGSVQSSVRIGRPSVPAPHPDHVPLRLTSTILGGSFTSRLMQNLREDKGYTYGARLGTRMYAAGGALVASADVRNEVTGAAVKEFFAEFERIGREPVPADELDMNKRYVAGSYLIANQQQGAVARTLANNWVVGLPPEFLGQYVPQIRAVTAEQVQQIGRTYFQPKQLSIVVVGDKAVLDQLNAYGEFHEPKPAVTQP